MALLAVDPSSRRSGGSLLGDRARIEFDPSDRGVLIRSTAAGERLGGIARPTRAAAEALAAAFDVVVIETVGVGQAETEVADVADTVAVVVQPGSGDVLQFLKSGIMEIPDVLVVTKADLGRSGDAHATRSERGAALARLALDARGGRLLARPAERHRGADRRAGGAPRGSRSARAPRCARGAPARWRSSPPSTASAGCARSAGAPAPSGCWPRRTRASPRRRSSRRSSARAARRGRTGPAPRGPAGETGPADHARRLRGSPARSPARSARRTSARRSRSARSRSRSRSVFVMVRR